MTDQDRLASVRAQAAREPAAAGDTGELTGWLHRLCGALVRGLPMSGAGVSLMTAAGGGGVAAASDDTHRGIEELQFTLGEGPCLDAFSTRAPVLEPDLAGAAMTRWPGYSPAAVGRGVRAVFALPLQVGAARLGVLDVYRHRSGSLSSPDLSRALTFAEVAVQTLLDGQDMASPDRAADGVDEAMEYRFEVYQAQGMVMVQLGTSPEEAMSVLRAHAYASDRRLGDVARDVVSGVLRLDGDSD